MTDINQSLLGTFQKHIEDMRNLSLCKICIKPFYEPFILGCGHTYCYSCLASWFGGAAGRKKNRNCPDCRAEVTVQPSPNYLLRDLVHMFIGRTELLPEDETVEEHLTAKDEEAGLLAADRAGPGLFKGVFLRRQHPVIRWGHGLLDQEDNVMRCPDCHWELEEGECLQCGFREFEAGDDSDTDSDDDSLDLHSLRTIETEYDSDGNPVPNDFDDPDDVHGRIAGLVNYYGTISENDDYDDDEDMDGFIDDGLDEVDEDDDDAGSEATMTAYHQDINGPARDPYNRQHYEDDNPEDEIATQANTYDEQSDVNTNYDEQTEVSDQESDSGPIRPQRRAPRIIISDDDDQEESSSDSEGDSEGDTTETSQDDDDDNDDDATSQSTDQDETEDGDSDSEESDDTAIRPPQSLARRRLHLQNLRTRRGSPSYQTHGQNNRGEHQQQSHIRHRTNQPNNDRVEYGPRRFNRTDATPAWRRGIRGY